MNFYPFHIGDYASATRHLTWDEDAAYRRLLDAYYTREGPLPLEPMAIYRLVVASSDAQRQAVQIVLEEFFVKTDDGWRHERCDAEIAKANDKKAKASASAMRRWNERNASAMPPQCEGNTNASSSTCERIETSCEGNAPNPNPNPNKNITPNTPQGGFAEFWSAYPKKVGKGEAEKAWKKAKVNGHKAEVLAALDAQKSSQQWQRDGGQYIPNPATWLNQRRWEDELPNAEPKQADMPLSLIHI